MRTYPLPAWLLLPLTLLCNTSAAEAVSSTSASANSPDLATTARQVPLRGQLQLTGLELEGLPGARELELERFRVFAPGARILVDGRESHPPPDNRYFKGRVADEPGSRVLLTLRQSGELRGLVSRSGELWMLAGGPGSGVLAPGLVGRRIEPDLEPADKVAGFSCETDALPPRGDRDGGPSRPTAEEVTTGPAGLTSYTARVAVETDYEYYSHFNNQADAVDYAADLVGYSSTIYQAEIDTGLEIDYLQLWTTPNDPWTETSCQNMLYEFRDFWNANRTGVDRTLAHMLSGKNAGCGIAWVGVLCNQTHGYGLSSGLSFGFDINNPGIGWDIMVVSHEIGHNFDSPHTHCYGAIPSSGYEPVDECYSAECSNPWYECHCGAAQLPCSGQSGCGTLMSYCHLLSGGMSNISLTFGAGHPYGFFPERVPTRMQEHVVEEAGENPGCLDPVIEGPELSITKQGSGTGTVTSEDGGIDCGSDCSQKYEPDTVVSLEATAGANSAFAGWSGDSDCNDGSLTMDEDKTCNATFELVERSLSVTKTGSGSGTVTSSPAGISCGSDCQEAYPHGTSVQLTATPAAGSVFSGWSGSADCSEGSLTMDADLSCTATFTQTWTLTVARSGSGTGTVTSNPPGISCGSDCQQVYDQGTSVWLTATPGANSAFAGWSGDADCADGTVGMSSNTSCTAIFTLLQRTLSVSRTGTGSGTVTSEPAGIDCGNDCQQSWDHGTAVELSATAGTSSIFNGWSGHSDCGDGRLTMDADKACAADFQGFYPLTVSKSGDGSGRVTSNPAGIDCGGDCTESYLHGTTVALQATPDFGSEVTGWSGDSDCSDGELAMMQARSCTITFGPCTLSSEENVSGQTVDDTREFAACNLLRAGDFLIQGPTGEVTFRAGNSIILQDGFVVEVGGSFRAIIGPPE